MVEFPQSTTRMVPASERLYAAITERRRATPPNPTLTPTSLAPSRARPTADGA